MAKRRNGLKAKKKKADAARAAYGPSGTPSRVTVRSLNDHSVVEVGHRAFAKGAWRGDVKAKAWLDGRARGLGYSSYSAYLRSPHWRRMRQQVLERDGRRCPCGATVGLEVHHREYGRLGSEMLADLATLCRGCHRKTYGRA